jgi:hypothetical protein
MKTWSQPGLEESLVNRASEDSFAPTSALIGANEPPGSWGFDLFRKCRTFDEVKALAKVKGLTVTNEFGRIQLFRQECPMGSFWLFD